MEGQCKFFNAEKYFGFVELSDQSGDVIAEYFFHGSRVIGKVPAKGDTLTFFIDEDRREGAWQAVDVTVTRQQ